MNESSARPDPLQLDHVADAAATARRYVRAALERLGRSDLIGSAELGVSELVTNACLHAQPPFVVAVVPVDASRVRITVSDAATAAPIARRHGPLATTGRGLRLLSAAGQWGVGRRPDGLPGKLVWFEPAGDLSEERFARTSVGEVWPDRADGRDG